MEHNLWVRLNKDKNYTEEDKELIKAIMESQDEIYRATNYFQLAKEPILIDYAIYLEQAAKAKYIYLLNQAKKRNIKISYKYVLKEANEV
ncbi:YaaL family protein [Clostridium peptidivorans]|uniref:YaaL family protein n=1 Tax=Clostridium peptidivorans TaxID=100174 RepID=UPI000BE2604F|nr:YaaL family protein [Clostridium peptidivorans]